MDEVRFIFESRDSEELLREANYKVRMRSRWILGIVLLLCGLVEAVFGYLYYSTVSVLLGLWLAAFGVYCLFFPMLEAKQFMRYERKHNGGQAPSATVTVTDKVTVTSKENLMVMLLADIKSVHFLNNGIILWGNEWIFTFDRRGMTKGTVPEFEQYLREKCPDAKFYHRESKKIREENP